MEPLLPPDIVWRKDKVGFEPPQKMWMQNENVQESIMEGKKLLVNHNILVKEELNKKIQPHDAYAAENKDWKFWSASFLFRN
jgi:asparagine synthase (glutamine-hydrolysing)